MVAKMGGKACAWDTFPQSAPVISNMNMSPAIGLLTTWANESPVTHQPKVPYVCLSGLEELHKVLEPMPPQPTLGSSPGRMYSHVFYCPAESVCHRPFL